MHLSGANSGRPGVGLAIAIAWMRSSPPRRAGAPARDGRQEREAAGSALLLW